MLDKHEIDRINEVARKNIENSRNYLEARKISAEAKFNLDVLIADGYRTGSIDKKMAYEKAQVIVGNQSPENQATWKEYSLAVAAFKGLERVIDANQSQLSLAQSMMKYEKENT